ncbi:MAG: ATP-binding protein [Endomicrobiia bacterium]|nr:ATP-binding protein [Endomicrobiia bacterium]
MLKDELEKLKKEWASKIMLSPGGESASELFLRRVDIIEAMSAEETSKLKKQNAALREENEIIRGLIGAGDVETKVKMLSLVEETRFLRDGITDIKKEADSRAEALEAFGVETETMKRDALIVEDVHKKELERLREIIAAAEKNLSDIVSKWKKKFDAASGELRSQRASYQSRLESASVELWGFSRVVLDGWVMHVRDTLGAVFGATDYLSACLGQKFVSARKLRIEIDPDIKLIKEHTARTVETFNKMAEFFSVKPELKKTDVNAIFRRLKERYSRLFALSVKWPQEKEYPSLVCDETLLADALGEFIANSVDALGGENARSGSIEVALLCDDIFFAFEVGDSGAGVPRENEEKLFTPLFTTKPGRDGLGLVRAKRNILFHGGEILYSSGKFRFKISHE